MTRWDDATVAKGLHIMTHDKTLTKQQRDATECIFLLKDNRIMDSTEVNVMNAGEQSALSQKCHQSQH